MQGEVLEKINYSAVGETVYQTVLANGLRVFFCLKMILMKLMGLSQLILVQWIQGLFHVKPSRSLNIRLE